MFHKFLLNNQSEILAMTEDDSMQLAGVRPSPTQLKHGLPIFYQQLLHSLKRVQPESKHLAKDPLEDGLASPSIRSGDAFLSKTSGQLGVELLHLGYTLAHVVQTYGSLCQAITSAAIAKRFDMSATDFKNLNHCLDVAIAGAVTEFQSTRDVQVKGDEIKRCGSSAHELRNALGCATMALQMIKSGSVGLAGSTGQVLERSLKRMEDLISKSLIEVKLRPGAAPQIELTNVLALIEQILVTANTQAQSKHQSIETEIDPNLCINVDTQLFHSAASNLIQNAIKYSHSGGKIQIRAHRQDDNVTIQVQDQCGGLKIQNPNDLFEPFEQHNDDRKGLGLGLTISRKAIELHGGTINVSNLPGEGCVFTISIPSTL